MKLKWKRYAGFLADLLIIGFAEDELYADCARRQVVVRLQGVLGV